MRTIVIDPGHGGEEQGARGPWWNAGEERHHVGRQASNARSKVGSGCASFSRGMATRRLDSMSAPRWRTTTRPICSSARTPTRQSHPYRQRRSSISASKSGEQAQRVAHAEPESLPCSAEAPATSRSSSGNGASPLHRAVGAASRDGGAASARADESAALQQALFRAPLARTCLRRSSKSGFVSNPQQEQQLQLRLVSGCHRPGTGRQHHPLSRHDPRPLAWRVLRRRGTRPRIN